MQRVTLTMLVSVIAGFCGLAAVAPSRSAIPLSSSPDRDIEIEVLTETAPDSLFTIGEVFDLRNHEGFQIWTHQSHFWQTGDFFDTSSLDVDVVFDRTQVIEPFVFWRSSAMRDVYDENGHSMGRFLAADMNIGVSTSELDLGEHSLMVRVVTPHGKVFNQSWQFVIRERETPRLDIPPDLVPTAEYLRQFPLPTPDYVIRLSTQPIPLDRFSPIGSGEGLCLTLDDKPFVPVEVTNNPFRIAMWDDITIKVDNILLNDNRIGIQDSDSPGVLFLCIDTDFLAAGTHYAELSFVISGTTYSFPWAFVVE